MITTVRKAARRALVSAVLVFGCVTITSPAQALVNGPVRFHDAPIAAYRVNGVGYATLIAGNTVYLGGTFTTVSNQQGQAVGSRANVAAFDKTTGALLGTFQANTNGMVRALAFDGTNLYLGGDFTTVNGVARSHLAAVDPLTGAVRAGWRANTNRVYALAVGGNRLFVAGTFGTIGGVTRNRVAATNLTTGAVDPTFNPNVNNTVLAIAARPDGSRVYIGGPYTAVGGTPTSWLTALDGTTGAVTAPTFQSVSGVALDLQMAPDGTHMAVAMGGDGNQGAWYDLNSGVKLWRQRCGGDGQAVAVVGTTMLSGFHEECDGDFTIRLVSNSTTNGSRDGTWLPSFDRFWGVRDLATDDTTLVVAGDFTNVAGVASQGLAIFTALPPPPPPPVTLPNGSVWRYLDSGVAQAGWADPAFVDTTWASGAAQMGYGDGDEATVISFGPNANTKYITSWFRTTFSATAVPSTLTLDLVADDGAIVYLNGVEVLRDNVGAGADSATLRAATGRSGSAENLLRSFALPPGLVHAGTNTIAVSVHQDLPTSSDVSFDAGLRSTT